MKNGKKIKTIDTKAKKAIYNYSWPGNIRELRNSIESALVMTEVDVLKFEDLPQRVQDDA